DALALAAEEFDPIGQGVEDVLLEDAVQGRDRAAEPPGRRHKVVEHRPHRPEFVEHRTDTPKLVERHDLADIDRCGTPRTINDVCAFIHDAEETIKHLCGTGNLADEVI